MGYGTQDEEKQSKNTTQNTKNMSKKSLKGQSESVNRRRTDNTMAR